MAVYGGASAVTQIFGPVLEQRDVFGGGQKKSPSWFPKGERAKHALDVGEKNCPTVHRDEPQGNDQWDIISIYASRRPANVFCASLTLTLNHSDVPRAKLARSPSSLSPSHRVSDVAVGLSHRTEQDSYESN
jgi:hypothetical protein